MLEESARKQRRDAQLSYLVQKIAIVEAMTGQSIDHSLFDDPENDNTKTKNTLSDGDLAKLGIVRAG